MESEEQRLSLLYCEDEAETREIVSAALAEEYPGLPVYTAVDGAEGLELFRRHRPEVVVTDIRMPVMDGLQMATAIKAIDAEVEVIALTAYSDTDFLISAIEVGFSQYVLKPTDFDRLFAAIGKSLATRTLNRRVNEQNERIRSYSIELERRLEELRESEERFAATFNQAAVGIAHIAPDGTFLRTNRRYCEIAACVGIDMKFLTHGDSTHPEDLPSCLHHHQLLLQGKLSSYSLEKRYVHPDGRVVWVRLNASLVSDRQGNPSFIVVVIDDITERKEAEEALRRSERRFSTIFHSVPATITMSSLSEARCIDINEAGLEMLGYERYEIVGKSFVELGVWEKQSDREGLLRLLETEGEVRDLEVNLREKSGRRHTVLFSAERVEFEKEPYLLSIITDITQRKRMEEEILRLNSDLQGANSELKSFNYTVAHDLRKPLTVINGYCQVLLELCSDRLDEECIGYLDETYEATLRMNRLIDSLLLFSQAAYSELKRERVNLSEFARETARELETAEPERKVIFRIEEGIEAEGDANLLRAVLANLFGNAWKYTSETADARIEFGAEMTPKGFSCFVRDNGMGFDAAEAGEIFTPFRRLSRGERIGGLGIGLATVQRVVSRHGGTVWAEGTPGAGATFYFQLPQTKQGQPDQSPPRPA